MKKQKRITIADFKDANGLWARSYSPKPYEVHRTRASRLWEHINTRCLVGGAYQKKNPTYVGTTNGFKDFQEFAEWCQHQYGYMNKETNGKFWQLDKDLKVFGNKVYSPETCIFVPLKVNGLQKDTKQTRGSYPIGVSYHKRDKIFTASCSSHNGETRYLGNFKTAHEAHQAWQEYKVKLLHDICTKYIEIVDHTYLIQALLSNAQRILDDIVNDRETV